MNKDELRKVQLVELDILCAIDNFCQKNNIKYSLGFGTALGAMRHGGFIPWDDDIDICMLRSEYERFISAWKEQPVDGFFMQSTESFDPNNSINHIKIRKDGTIMASKEEVQKPGHHGIWVDIFPFDKLPKNNRDRKKVLVAAKSRIVMSRSEIVKNKGLFVRLVTSIVHRLPIKIRQSIWNYSNQVISKTNMTYCDYDLCCFSMTATIKLIFPSDCLDHFGKITFENIEFPVSSKINEMLRISYGDYQKLPPIEERVCLHEPEVLIFN